MDEISSAISKEWVGLILLPAISSVAGKIYKLFNISTELTILPSKECITAVKVSVKDELTLSVSVAVGSTIVSAII